MNYRPSATQPFTFLNSTCTKLHLHFPHWSKLQSVNFSIHRQFVRHTNQQFVKDVCPSSINASISLPQKAAAKVDLPQYITFRNYSSSLPACLPECLPTFCIDENCSTAFAAAATSDRQKFFPPIYRLAPATWAGGWEILTRAFCTCW